MLSTVADIKMVGVTTVDPVSFPRHSVEGLELHKHPKYGFEYLPLVWKPSRGGDVGAARADRGLLESLKRSSNRVNPLYSFKN